MTEPTDLQHLEDVEQLERFFLNLTRAPTRVLFRETELETFAVGAPSVAAALLFSWWYGLVARWGRERRGTHVKVLLPKPVGADLHLESRAKAIEADDPLESHFVWSASSERRVREYLSGSLLEALVKLNESAVVTVTDHFISFGPLPHEPGECAQVLAALIEVLPAPATVEEPAKGAPYRGGAEEQGKMVVVATSAIHRQVDLWASKLEAAHITHDIYGYDVSQPWGSATPMRPIELGVYEADRAQAIEILQTVTEEAVFCHNCGEVVPADTEHCPSCGEELIEAT